MQCARQNSDHEFPQAHILISVILTFSLPPSLPAAALSLRSICTCVSLVPVSADLYSVGGLELVVVSIRNPLQ